jgi:cytochrome P450
LSLLTSQINSRIADVDTELGGFFVPKGAKVLINSFAICRDPKYYEDPLTFSPERCAAAAFSLSLYPNFPCLCVPLSHHTHKHTATCTR